MRSVLLQVATSSQAARAATLITAAMVAIVFGIWTHQWQRRAQRVGANSFNYDYHKVFRAVQRWAAGENPYTAARRLPEALWAAESPPEGANETTLAYPPLVPVVNRPLVSVGWPMASRTWAWLNIALLVSAVLLAAGAAEPDSWWLPVPLLALTVLLWPMGLSFKMGNSEVLLLFCYALSAWALRRNRDGLYSAKVNLKHDEPEASATAPVQKPSLTLPARRVKLSKRPLLSIAGTAIGFAAAFKLTPIVLVAALLAWRRWRAAAAAVGTAVGLTAAAAALIGPSCLGDFAVAYSFKLHPNFLAIPQNQSPTGFLLRGWCVNDFNWAFAAESHHPTLALGLGLSLSAVAVGAFLLTELRAGRAADWSPISLGWALATMLVALPFAHPDYIAALFVAWAAILAGLPRQPRRIAALTAGLLLGVLILVGLRDSEISKEVAIAAAWEVDSIWLKNLRLSQVMLGCLLQWGLLAGLRWRELRGQELSSGAGRELDGEAAVALPS